jgi:PhoH-like ATPase
LKTQQSKEKHSNAKYPKISVSKSQKERRQESETRIPVENLEMTFDKLVAAGIIEIEAEAFIRGRSFENVIVVIDEAQNFSAAAAKTWMTRMGDGSKLIMTGDVTQIDTPYLSKNNNALSHSAVKTDDQVWSSTIFLDLGVRSIMSDWAANNL